MHSFTVPRHCATLAVQAHDHYIITTNTGECIMRFTRVLTYVFMTALYVLVLSGCSTSLVTSPSFPREFHTKDTQIVDASDNPLQFRGVNILDPIWLSTGGAGIRSYNGAWSEAIFETIADMGANVVRCPIHPGMWETVGEAESFRIIDQTLEWAAKHDLYIIIDFHGIGFPPYEELGMPPEDVYMGGPGLEQHGILYMTTIAKIYNFWTKVAIRYADDNRVFAFELFNEPAIKQGTSFPWNLNTALNWNRWKTFSEKLIDRVRVYAPNKPVIVGGLNFAYDLSFAGNNPVNRPNVIYATHPYPGKELVGKSWDVAFGNLAGTFPVIATEFAFNTTPLGTNGSEFNYSGPGPYRGIIEYMEEKHISWTPWCFSSYVGFKMLKEDTTFSFTEYGTFIKDNLLAHEQESRYSAGASTSSIPADIDKTVRDNLIRRYNTADPIGYLVATRSKQEVLWIVDNEFRKIHAEMESRISSRQEWLQYEQFANDVFDLYVEQVNMRLQQIYGASN